MKVNKRISTFPFFHFSKLFLVFLIFLFFVLYSERSGIESTLIPSGSSQAPKTITVEKRIEYVTPTPTPFAWTVEKINEHETQLSLPPDPRMSTADELFDEMNSYRSSHKVPTVQKDDLLCSIAQNRANEQLANGALDDHAGFDKYAQNQNEFSTMGEVLFGGGQPQYAVHIVEYGWDRSLTGHREAIQDPSWQYGCGGIAGYYAVFIFGKK